MSHLHRLPPSFRMGKAAKSAVDERERRRKCQNSTHNDPNNFVIRNTYHLEHRNLRGQVCQDKGNNRLGVRILDRFPSSWLQAAFAHYSPLLFATDNQPQSNQKRRI